MNVLGHEIKVDFSEASTIRGIVWAVGGIVSMAFLALSGVDKALAAVSIIASIAGGLGVAIKDKKE